MVEAIVSNNFMASPFQRYQGGIEASTGNLVPASGKMAELTYNTIAGFGQNIAEGIKKYNQNAAENEILDGEALALSEQIVGFQKMFADPQTGQINPEYAPFAESLTPDIQTLAKFNSMSLNQKKGVMTGMKARFANIGQNLTAFEMTKKARLLQDMNMARGGVKEFDEVTVPTAIIPSGKLPYFHDKSYAQNEAEVVRLANEAKARGANVDISKTLSDWRNDFKASAMSRNDIPPAVKEALVKQIEAGENLTDNIQTDESGVTDYAKEAEMYEKTATSVKEQLAPPKVEAPKQEQKISPVQEEITALQKRREELNKTKNSWDKVEGSVLPSLAGWTSRQISDAMQNEPAFQALARSRKMVTGEKITPEVAKELVEEFSSFKHMGIPLVGGSIKALTDSVVNLFGAENLTKRDKENIAVALNDYKSKMNADSEYRNTGIDKSAEREIIDIDARIERLQKKIPVSQQQQVGVQQGTEASAPAKEEQPYVLTNQRNMALGTTTTQVAASVESKRNDMKNFFTKKYGYVPASFEESFKAIYPEANFKTMETPYGVFMHDGKDWKQVQMQQVKPPSRKELAEEKAVSFGRLQSDSSIDINEFGELVPNSGVYVRGIFSGSPTDATKFRQQMLEGSNAKKAVGRLIEINNMVGESMPWNAKVWGEAKALLPQIKAGLRTDIIGVGTVSNYEQELINDVVANPTLFWSLESSDRAKLAVIMDKISNRLVQEPANYGLEVKVAGKSNAEMERTLRLGRAGKSKLELDFEARGGKTGMYSGGSTGAKLNWDLSNKIPDALK